MNENPHFTTRRGFIAASGFGGVSLYGLWAAYGAAPSPLALLGLQQNPHADPSETHAGHGPASTEATPADAGGHAGHGSVAQGPASEEFSRLTTEFSERYRMPDGSVYPRRLQAQGMQAVMDMPAGHDMSSHGMPSDSPEHAQHAGAAPTPTQISAEHAGHASAALGADPDQPIDVLMVAGKWYYLPSALRLDVGQAYRFRMMSMDITHGASIQLGQAARMMRLQPGRITQASITFTKPGRYLMYCTVYCGDAHQLMQATLEVV